MRKNKTKTRLERLKALENKIQKYSKVPNPDTHRSSYNLEKYDKEQLPLIKELISICILQEQLILELKRENELNK